MTLLQKALLHTRIAVAFVTGAVALGFLIPSALCWGVCYASNRTVAMAFLKGLGTELQIKK